MSILTENWKEKLSQMLDRDIDQVDAFIKKKDFSFSDFLTLAQAVEDEDVDTVLQMFKTASDIEESDNPFGSVSNVPTTPTTSTTKPMAGATATSSTTKDVDSLTPGDKTVVRDLSGDEVEATIKSRGPGDTYVVTGNKAGQSDQVVKKDSILATPVVESYLSESINDGLQTLRTTLPQYKQDPPSITKKAIQEIYKGHQLPPRLSIAIEPYIRMLETVISDPTMRYRFINLIKLATNNVPTEPETSDVDVDLDIDAEQKPVKTETTTAGAIASAPVSVGKPIQRKQRGVYSERTKKK